jgi:hypothetical protein
VLKKLLIWQGLVKNSGLCFINKVDFGERNTSLYVLFIILLDKSCTLAANKI